MNKWLPDWLAFAIFSCVLAFYGLGIFGAGLVLAATETASISEVKSLYGVAGAPSGRTDASTFELPTQTSPPAGPHDGIKPTAAAIRCPDGVTRSALEILLLVRQANPKLPIWDEPELAQALSGERGVWQWIKDHVKITINAFGLHFQLHGDGGFCGQLTVMWWNGWNATWEPC